MTMKRLQLSKFLCSTVCLGWVLTCGAQTHVWTGRGGRGAGNAGDLANWNEHKPLTEGVSVRFSGRSVLLPETPEVPDNKVLDFHGGLSFELNRPMVVEGGYTLQNFSPQGVTFFYDVPVEFRGRNTIDGNFTWRQNNTWTFEAVPAESLLTVTGDLVQEMPRNLIFRHEGTLLLGGSIRASNSVGLESAGRLNVDGNLELPGAASLVVDGGGVLRLGGDIQGANNGHPATPVRRVRHGTLILNGELASPQENRGGTGYQIHGTPEGEAVLGGKGIVRNQNGAGAPFQVGMGGSGRIQPGDLVAVREPERLTLAGGTVELGPSGGLRIRVFPEFAGNHRLVLEGAVLRVDPDAVLAFGGPPLNRGARLTIVELKDDARIEGTFQNILYNGRPVSPGSRITVDRQGMHIQLIP